jgi:hypothetical protein
VAINGGSYDVPPVAAECDGSVLYIGAFDYVSGTSGDVAKGVTNATNTVDHATLPNPDKPEPKRGKTLPLCHETINGKIQRKDIIWSVLL